MLDFKDTDAREILVHPVMETYLDLKWKKVKIWFLINFATYVIYLVSYSLFLANIFYRKKRIKKIKITGVQ